MEKDYHLIVYRLHTKSGRIYTFRKKFKTRELALDCYDNLRSVRENVYIIHLYHRSYIPCVGVACPLLKSFYRYEDGKGIEFVYSPEFF